MFMVGLIELLVLVSSSSDRGVDAARFCSVAAMNPKSLVVVSAEGGLLSTTTRVFPMGADSGRPLVHGGTFKGAVD